jgi:hypothetical protein
VFLRGLLEDGIFVPLFENLLSFVDEFESGFVVLEGEGAIEGFRFGLLLQGVPAIIMGHVR